MMSEDDRERIADVVEIISRDMLNLKEIPEVVFNNSDKMQSDTMIALAEVGDGKSKIYLTPHIDISPPLIFYIGHELRHIKQWEDGKSGCTFGSDVFATYKSVVKLGVKEYNKQELEIDAHAFGIICQEEITHTSSLHHLFDTLPPKDEKEIVEKIEAREKEILRDEFGIEL